MGQPDRSLVGGYGMVAHGDFTMRSGITRAEFELQSHETEQHIRVALGQRFAFVNVWVPLKKVERNPLAMLQWGSVAPRDVVTSTWHFPHRTGETYRVMHSDSHRWVYFPRMVPGECIVFKQFDSATDGRARIALHSAFHDPTSAPTAPQRESIELRCMVFFGDLPNGFADNWPNVPDPIMKPDRYELGPISDMW